jgi:hypothetical protein
MTYSNAPQMLCNNVMQFAQQQEQGHIDLIIISRSRLVS